MNQVYQEMLKKENSRNFQNIFSLESNKDILGFSSEPEAKIKTEICRNWEAGSCEYGDKCFFAHGMKELREKFSAKIVKTQKCESFFKFGYCMNGIKCQFKHTDDGEGLSSTQALAKKNMSQALPEKFNAPIFVDLESRSLYQHNLI